MALAIVGGPPEAAGPKLWQPDFRPVRWLTTTEEDAAGEGDTESDDDGPGLSAYGEVAEEYKEQSTIEMTQQSVGVFQQKLRRFMSSVPKYPDCVGAHAGSQKPDW